MTEHGMKRSSVFVFFIFFSRLCWYRVIVKLHNLYRICIICSYSLLFWMYKKYKNWLKTRELLTKWKCFAFIDNVADVYSELTNVHMQTSKDYLASRTMNLRFIKYNSKRFFACSCWTLVINIRSRQHILRY